MIFPQLFYIDRQNVVPCENTYLGSRYYCCTYCTQSNQINLVADNCKDWLLDCVLKDSAVMRSHTGGSHRGRVRPPVLMIDSMLSIFFLLLFQACSKDHWHCISLPTSFNPPLYCAKKLDPVLKATLFRIKFFWSPNCLCDYRQIDTLWCPQPAHPAGTGNDAIHAALTLTGPREATASLTRKMLSISSAGWLCLVIVMLARLWHFCHVDGKCLSNHLLVPQFEFSSTLMDSSWRIIIKKMKSSLTLNATAAATPWRHPAVLVTVAQCLPPGCCPLAVVLLPRG